MTNQLFLNLAIKDLNKTIAFFTELGFSFNPKFTNENATCIIINSDSFIMLLTEPFFKGFLKKEMADAHKCTEALVGYSVDSKEAVNTFVDKAVKLGGTESGKATDHGFMYSRSFNDLDGHVWEIFWMDMNGMPTS